MNKERHNIVRPWKSLGCVLSISVCIGVYIISIPALRTYEIITLAATSAQDTNQNSEPPTNSSQDVNQHSDAPGNADTASNSAPAIPQPANPSVHVVTQAAVKLGVLSCLKRINQVTTFLTANTQSGVFIFPVQKQPDEHVFSTSFELIRPDESTIYASASFFPNQDAVYDTVEYVNVGCEELEKTVFKDLKRVGVVKKGIVLLDGGAVKVFLMPAGSGCVVIKKEVVQ